MSIIFQLLIDTIIVGTNYSFFGLVFILNFFVTKFYNFSYANSFVVSGYVLLYLLETLHAPLALAIGMGILSGGIVAYAQDKLVYSPLRKQHASPMVFMIASIGLLLAVREILAILFTQQFQPLSTLIEREQVIQMGQGVITSIQLITFALFIVFLISVVIILHFTRYGAVIKTVSQDVELAKSIGVDVDNIIRKVAVFCGLFGGAAGILLGLDTGLKPSLASQVVLKGIGAALIAGLGFGGGHVYSCVIAAFALGGIENIGVWVTSGGWRDMFSYGFLLLVLTYNQYNLNRRAWII